MVLHHDFDYEPDVVEKQSENGFALSVAQASSHTAAERRGLCDESQQRRARLAA